jgi:hypothetical protein
MASGFWEVVMSFPMVGQEFSYRYFEVIELLACGVEWRQQLNNLKIPVAELLSHHGKRHHNFPKSLAEYYILI